MTTGVRRSLLTIYIIVNFFKIIIAITFMNMFLRCGADRRWSF